jgi:hypothetical protein
MKKFNHKGAEGAQRNKKSRLSNLFPLSCFHCQLESSKKKENNFFVAIPIFFPSSFPSFLCAPLCAFVVKILTKALRVMLLFALVFTACDMDSIPDDTALSEEIMEAKKGTLDKRAPGLYLDEGLVPFAPSAEESFLAAAFAWLAVNAESDALYRIVLGADEGQTEMLLYPGALNGASPVSVVLSGSGNRRIIRLEGTGSMYGVRDGVTLTAGAGITLNGSPGNYRPLIDIREGGTFVMEEGSLLRENTNILDAYTDTETGNSGGGVGVRAGGSFVMNGGEINGCQASHGGGVAITGGTFALNDGAIMSNVARQGGGVYLEGDGSAFSMAAGTICGNIAPRLLGPGPSGGGGVYGGRGSAFSKTGGVITAYTSLPLKGNKVTGSGGGISRLDSHAVYQEFAAGGSASLSRTILPGHSLDSGLPGKDGGWYDE